MTARRAAFVAVFGCCLLASATILAGFAFATEPAASDRHVARAPSGSGGSDSATARACPARASTTRPTTAPPPRPRIVGLSPNPTTDDDAGEFVVLETPPDTRLAELTLTDGHTTAALPNETVSGRVALSTAPNVTETLTDTPVLALEGHLQLANGGDRLRLRNATTTVDAVSYDSAPAAERWYRTAASDEATPVTDGRWWPRDATCLPVSSAAVDEATAFVLPDAPGVPRKTIRSADERLFLAGYTVTSEAVAADLVDAAERGVEVKVLLEASPVGGTPAPTAAVLETLADGGVDVRVIGGDGARYRYHHPKYAVADDRVLVTTENWKPAGVGGESSRGWGVRLEDEALAADLAGVFRADFEGWDTTAGAAYRANTSFVDDDDPVVTARDTAFPTVHEPATVPVESAELLVAPDNAEYRLQELLRGADDEILVVQPSIATDVSLLESTLEAARRGVDVRILLGSTWYNTEENERLAADLERLAASDDLSLEVQLVSDTDRFEKIHAKGIVIDREVAIVGSANWNENSLENNREVLVALHGAEIATYYADVFEADWSGDAWRFPIGLSAAVVAALVAAAIVGRRYVRFGGPPSEYT